MQHKMPDTSAVGEPKRVFIFATASTHIVGCVIRPCVQHAWKKMSAHLHKQQRNLFPPSYCCCGTQSTGGCQWRWSARAAYRHRNDLGHRWKHKIKHLNLTTSAVLAEICLQSSTELHTKHTASTKDCTQLSLAAVVFWNWMSFNFFSLTQKLTRRHLEVCCSLAALWIQLKLTFKWCLPPVSISDLHVVIPTQVTPVQIHGGEVQNDLNKKIKTHYWDSRGQRSHIAKSQINMMKPINCINMKEPEIWFEVPLSKDQTLSVSSYLFPRCDWYSPDAVHVGRVSIWESRRGKIPAAVLQAVSTSCAQRQTHNCTSDPMLCQSVSVWNHLSY